MPKRKVIYISPIDRSRWGVKGEGAQRALKNFENKKDAIDFGRQIAKNAELGQLKIQKRTGHSRQSTPIKKTPSRRKDERKLG